MWPPIPIQIKILIELTIVIILGLVIKFLKSKTEQVTNLNSYSKRESVMTKAEQQFFRQLCDEYGKDYFIFPQINLDKLVTVTGKKWDYALRNKIDRKSVDFVLADKETLQTKLIIELDDFSHELSKRKKRDQFVEGIFKNCEIKILRVKQLQQISNKSITSLNVN